MKTTKIVKKFKCHFCEKNYKYNYHLNRHLKKCKKKVNIIIKDYDKFLNTKKEICEKYIVPIVSFENDVETIPDNVLVIHFRGGDAWDSSVHPQYTPFPYSHIKKVAEKYDEIIIVHQDETNLIMKKFVSDFSEKIIKTVSSSLRHDISYLMNATNLLQTSVGTFLPAIALMSKKIKN